MEGNNVADSVPELENAKGTKKKTSAERVVSYKYWFRFYTNLYLIDNLEKVQSKQN